MTQKERTTIVFDDDVFSGVLAIKATPEGVRKSFSRIVNELLRKALEEDKNGETADV